MLLGLVRPDAGTIRVLGGPPGDAAVLRQVGTMGETAFYPFLSGGTTCWAMAWRCLVARYAGRGRPGHRGPDRAGR